jgi:hypothetical protein
MGLGRGNSQKRLVQFVRIRILFAEIGTGNRQKQGFVNKNRHIVSVKNMVGYAIAGTPKNTNIPNLRPMSILVYLPGRFYPFDLSPLIFQKRICIIISNFSRLSKEKNALI